MSSVIEVVVATPVIDVIQDGLDTVEVVEAVSVIEVVDGLSLPGDVVAALNAADSPSALNPFATVNQGDAVRFARLFMMGA